MKIYEVESTPPKISPTIWAELNKGKVKVSPTASHIYFKVTTAGGGSLERVMVEMRDLEEATIYKSSLRDIVAHAAWRKLFNDEKGKHPMMRSDKGNTAKMLKAYVINLG